MKSLNSPYKESTCVFLSGSVTYSAGFVFVVASFLLLWFSLFCKCFSLLATRLSSSVFVFRLLLLLLRLLEPSFLSPLFSLCLSYSLKRWSSISRLSFLLCSFEYFSTSSSFSFFNSKLRTSTSLSNAFYALYFSLKSSSFVMIWCSKLDLCSSCYSRSFTLRSWTPYSLKATL